MASSGAGLLTVNYERELGANVALRVGGGAVPLIGYDVVLMAGLGLARGHHRFSGGAGPVLVWYADGPSREVFPTVEMAYRFQKSSGVVFRAALAYTIPNDGERLDKRNVVPGFSVGWSF